MTWRLTSSFIPHPSHHHFVASFDNGSQPTTPRPQLPKWQFHCETLRSGPARIRMSPVVKNFEKPALWWLRCALVLKGPRTFWFKKPWNLKTESCSFDDQKIDCATFLRGSTVPSTHGCGSAWLTPWLVAFSIFLPAWNTPFLGVSQITFPIKKPPKYVKIINLFLMWSQVGFLEPPGFFGGQPQIYIAQWSPTLPFTSSPSEFSTKKGEACHTVEVVELVDLLLMNKSLNQQI